MASSEHKGFTFLMSILRRDMHHLQPTHTKFYRGALMNRLVRSLQMANDALELRGRSEIRMQLLLLVSVTLNLGLLAIFGTYFKTCSHGFVRGPLGVVDI